MPVYTYRREDGSTFDFRQRFLDSPLEECPTTGQAVSRVIQPAGIIFKGSGWYATDSRSASERKKFKQDGKPPEKSDSTPVKTDGAKSNGSATDSGAKAGASAGGSDKASGSGGSSD